MKHSKFYIAATLMLLTVFSCKSKAQKLPEKQDPNFKTNTAELQRLKKAFKAKQVSEEDLKRRAEKLGIPYRIENKDGSIQQLAGFDSNGKPMYRTTNTLSQPKIVPREELSRQEGHQEKK